MRTALPASILTILLASACQPEPSTSPDGVATSAANQPAEASVQEPSPSPTPSHAPGAPELSLAGIGPVKLGMTWAELVWAGLEPESIDGGAAVGPFRAGFAPARGGPITSVHVTLGDLPEGLLVNGKLLVNESTSLQALADAIGSCEPIEPIIGQGSTTCHDGRVTLRGAGPVGGLLSVTVRSS